MSAEADKLLRFLTCGSVDDGKSTLIGRLLHDASLILDDQLDALADASRKHGTTGEELDFALLVDGLEAEREQGITIDVAYRYFARRGAPSSSPTRPATSSIPATWRPERRTAELAVILVDARKGLLTQTLRHATIVSLLGIRHVVLAVNKIDLVGFRQPVFDAIVDGFRKFAAALTFNSIAAIPVSARARRQRDVGEPQHAVVRRTRAARISGGRRRRGRASRTPFRMPVQWVNRPHLDFRGYCRNHRGRRGSRRRHGRGRRIGPHRAGRAHRHGVGRPRAGASRRRRHAGARPTSSTSRAATCSPIRQTRRRSPTSSPRI